MVVKIKVVIFTCIVLLTGPRRELVIIRKPFKRNIVSCNQVKRSKIVVDIKKQIRDTVNWDVCS